MPIEPIELSGPAAYEAEAVERVHPREIASPGVFTGLTPDMIIFMVRKQVNEMDAQIKGSIGEIENTRSDAKRLGQEIMALQEFKRTIEGHATMMSDGVINLTRVDDHDRCSVREMFGISNEAGEDEATAALRNALNDAPYKLGIGASTTEIRMSAITQKIDELTEDQRVINSGVEMTMMRLQSAMQMRTQILQLGSNMLSSQNEASGTIIGNLR